MLTQAAGWKLGVHIVGFALGWPVAAPVIAGSPRPPLPSSGPGQESKNRIVRSCVDSKMATKVGLGQVFKGRP
ncbi:hypothetical protein QBC39DRAFT_358809 [Podospora conica]|nr:hypothetical protein QBC39DRAFT_358809 [Schizothecium conicum]